MKSARRVWTSGWTQAGVAVVAFVLAATLLWWRGPDWGSVLDAFSLVIWSWIILAFALNVLKSRYVMLAPCPTHSEALPLRR